MRLIILLLITQYLKWKSDKIRELSEGAQSRALRLFKKGLNTMGGYAIIYKEIKNE